MHFAIFLPHFSELVLEIPLDFLGIIFPKKDNCKLQAPGKPSVYNGNQMHTK